MVLVFQYIPFCNIFNVEKNIIVITRQTFYMGIIFVGKFLALPTYAYLKHNAITLFVCIYE